MAIHSSQQIREREKRILTTFIFGYLRTATIVWCAPNSSNEWKIEQFNSVPNTPPATKKKKKTGEVQSKVTFSSSSTKHCSMAVIETNFDQKLIVTPHHHHHHHRLQVEQTFFLIQFVLLITWNTKLFLLFFGSNCVVFSSGNDLYLQCCVKDSEKNCFDVCFGCLYLAYCCQFRNECDDGDIQMFKQKKDQKKAIQDLQQRWIKGILWSKKNVTIVHLVWLCCVERQTVEIFFFLRER